MMIGAVSFQPYVYNINAISPASMNRLSRISDDVLDKKTDFRGLAQADNENPLKMGQTLDFRGMLEMQMQRGRSNAARVMKPAEDTVAAQETAQTENVAVKSGRENEAGALQPEKEAADSAQNVQAAAPEAVGMEYDVSNFRMQQAISAYEMFMTA